MAIQAQFYCNNNNNCYCVDDGFVESCFNSQPQKKQHVQQQQQLQLEHCLQQFVYNESQSTLLDPGNGLLYDQEEINNNHHTNLNLPSLDAQLEMQIDQCIKLQNAKLRLMIQEQGKQQVTALLRKVESHSLAMLRKKDEEIAQATKRRVELEDYLIRLEAENQAWQRVAQENEAIALSLHKTIEDMREKVSNCFDVVENDAESCCDEWMGEEKEEEGIGKMLCKRCNSREMCCLFLPCRHLSLCKDCGYLVEACPLCRTPKKATIEALIF